MVRSRLKLQTKLDCRGVPKARYQSRGAHLVQRAWDRASEGRELSERRRGGEGEHGGKLRGEHRDVERIGGMRWKSEREC